MKIFSLGETKYLSLKLFVDKMKIFGPGTLMKNILHDIPLELMEVLVLEL